MVRRTTDASRQEAFFQDANEDGRPDGLAYLTEDLNDDGVPDIFERAFKKLRRSLIIGYLLAGSSVVAATLLADWLGHKLGLH